jgi:hypothetical protein
MSSCESAGLLYMCKCASVQVHVHGQVSGLVDLTRASWSVIRLVNDPSAHLEILMHRLVGG